MDLLSKLWISLRNWRYQSWLYHENNRMYSQQEIDLSWTWKFNQQLWGYFMGYFMKGYIYIYYMILYVWSLRTCLWIGYTGICPQHYNELFNHWSFLYLICRRLELGIGIISAQSLDATLLCHRAMEGLPHRAAWQVSGGLGKKRNEVHLFLQ